MRSPRALVGSDGNCVADYGTVSQGMPHPRFYGTFPRIIGRYVGERGLIPLELAVHKMTGATARALNLADRGVLREGYREGGKIVKRTLANLSHWDAQLVEHFRLLLKGGVAVESLDAVMTIERSLPHGHVAAVLGAARACGAEKWFASAPEELRSVLLAMLCARVLGPASKLATHRMLHDDTATSSLGRVLGVGQCQADDLYRALDWLHEAQPTLEQALARIE